MAAKPLNDRHLKSTVQGRVTQCTSVEFDGDFFTSTGYRPERLVGIYFYMDA